MVLRKVRHKIISGDWLTKYRMTFTAFPRVMDLSDATLGVGGSQRERESIYVFPSFVYTYQRQFDIIDII